MPELTIVADIDSYMDGHDPDSNFGAGALINMGTVYQGGDKDALNRAIASFDVSQLAGETILAAEMRRALTLTAGAGADVTIYRCTRPAQWTENGVTWNKYDGSHDWASAGGDYDATTPAPVGYTIPEDAGNHTVAGLKGFIDDALLNRNGIVSIIIRLDDEVPEATQRELWHHGAYPTEALAWRLVVEYVSIATGPRRGTSERVGGKGPRRQRLPRRPATGRPPRQGHRPERAEGRKPWAP
jgi:hypothetical protein